MKHTTLARKKTESKLNRIVDGLMIIASFNMFFYLWPNANQEIYHVQLFRTHKHKIPMDFLLNARFCVFFPLSLSLETIESPQYSMNLKFVWVFEFVLNPLLLFFSYLFCILQYATVLHIANIIHALCTLLLRVNNGIRMFRTILNLNIFYTDFLHHFFYLKIKITEPNKYKEK